MLRHAQSARKGGPKSERGRGWMRKRLVNRRASVLIAVTAIGTAVAGAQTPTPAAPPKEFRLALEPLLSPRYEPAREVRIALFDSPMSRLELAVAREEWSIRHPGPAGMVVSFQPLRLPRRFSLAAGAGNPFIGPWSAQWDRLTWQEKVAAGTQTGLLIALMVEILQHAR